MPWATERRGRPGAPADPLTATELAQRSDTSPLLGTARPPEPVTVYGGWLTVCGAEDTSVLLVSRADGALVETRTRCKRVGCWACGPWQWKRQLSRLHKVTVNMPELWAAEVVTPGQWGAMHRQRERTGGVAGYLAVLHRDGTRFVATDHNLTPRSRVLAAYPVDEVLGALGVDYLRLDAMNRQPSSRWRVRTSHRRLGVGRPEHLREAAERAGISRGVPEGADFDAVVDRYRYELDKIRRRRG